MRKAAALYVASAAALICSSCAPGRQGDDILRVLKCPPDMVAVPGGPFLYGDRWVQGSEPEKLRLRGFCIDRYEHPNTPGEFPTVNVTWLEAKGHCASMGKRLCTEFEWEKAARGTNGQAFSYGSRFDGAACRYFGLSVEPRYITGRHPRCKSPYGAYDMSGGVWEWTENTYKPGGKEIAVRGGFSVRSLKLTARAAYRAAFDPSSRSPELGFRCCHTPPGKLKKPEEPEKKTGGGASTPPGQQDRRY